MATFLEEFQVRQQSLMTLIAFELSLDGIDCNASPLTQRLFNLEVANHLHNIDIAALYGGLISEYRTTKESHSARVLSRLEAEIYRKKNTIRRQHPGLILPRLEFEPILGPGSEGS